MKDLRARIQEIADLEWDEGASDRVKALRRKLIRDADGAIRLYDLAAALPGMARSSPPLPYWLGVEKGYEIQIDKEMDV